MARLSYTQTRKLMQIVSMFEVEPGDVDIIESFGAGRINKTYKITIRNESKRFEYLLQNVNSFVFPDMEGLMNNITSVTEYIHNNGGNSIKYIKCKNNISAENRRGEYVYVDNDSERLHWRMYHYIDADVYPCIINSHHAYMLGEAIAKFSTSLADFDTSRLIETIPNFHNTPKRYETLLISIAKDAINGNKRVSTVIEEISFVMKRTSLMGTLIDALNKKEIPYRVVHNDPKLSNVLFDKEKSEPICMIDLDTIMPGTSLFDVGDAIRSIANTASEDDITTENVSFSLDIYKEFINGYIKGMGDKLTSNERKLIPISVWVLSIELGMRFLTDHIDGNIYFKTDYDGQNVERARIQFKFAECIEELIEKGVLSKYVDEAVDNLSMVKTAPLTSDTRYNLAGN